MKTDYKPIKPMKEVPDQLRKLRRQFLRYQQAEIVYSLSHKKLLELASDAEAIYILVFLKSEGYFEIRQGAKCKSTDFYKIDKVALVNCEIFERYLESFRIA